MIQVQELHGTPWHNPSNDAEPERLPSAETSSPPSLSPSVSMNSVSSACPSTPPHTSSPLPCQSSSKLEAPRPPKFVRRPSHDLFECIEQSDNKCLSEDQARYVFAQIVDAVDYLDSLGVAHRDIKDENIVIDENLKVCSVLLSTDSLLTDPILGQTHRFWQRRLHRPCGASSVLRPILWDNCLCVVRDPAEEDVPSSACRGVDAWRPSFLSSYWLFTLPAPQGCRRRQDSFDGLSTRVASSVESNARLFGPEPEDARHDSGS